MPYSTTTYRNLALLLVLLVGLALLGIYLSWPQEQPSASSPLPASSEQHPTSGALAFNQPLNYTVSTGAAAGYVEDKVCGTCHSHIFETYQSIGMAKSFTRPTADKLIENFALPAFYHSPSQRYYQISRDGDDLIFSRWQVDSAGEPINRFKRKIDYILGSGHKTRSYLYQAPGGELYQLPLGWYSQQQQWGMSPGFDNSDHAGVTRSVPRQCLFCHNAFPQVPQGSDSHRQPHIFPAELPHGIGCQRCHGPGAKHVETVIQGAQSIDQIRQSIVNPVKLATDQRDSVCFQCHLLPSVDLVGIRDFARADYSFRPGEDINDYIHHVDIIDAEVAQPDRFEINHHAYRLRQSQCFAKSAGKLTCISCHNPHEKVAPERRESHYRAVCQGCHQAEHQPKLTDNQDCVTCHMPQRRTQDVVNVVVTDHKIQRNNAGRDWLAPLKETPPIIDDLDFLMVDKAPAGDMAQIYKVVTVLRAMVKPSYIDYLQTLLERVQPTDRTPYFDLISGQLSLQRYAGAEQTSRMMLQHYPDDPRLKQWLATALMGQHKLDEAELVYKALIDQQKQTLQPEIAEVYFNYGLLQKAKEQPQAAELSLAQALALRPNLVAAWYYRGEIAEQQLHHDQAIEYYQTALAIDPSHSRSYLGLAQALLAIGDKPQAYRYLEHGVKVAKRPQSIAEKLQQLSQ